MVDLKAGKHPDDTHSAYADESGERRDQRLSETSHRAGQVVHQHVESLRIEQQLYPENTGLDYLRLISEQPVDLLRKEADKKREGSRALSFEEERAFLMPLPPRSYELAV